MSAAVDFPDLCVSPGFASLPENCLSHEEVDAGCRGLAMGALGPSCTEAVNALASTDANLSMGSSCHGADDAAALRPGPCEPYGPAEVDAPGQCEKEAYCSIGSNEGEASGSGICQSMPDVDDGTAAEPSLSMQGSHQHAGQLPSTAAGHADVNSFQHSVRTDPAGTAGKESSLTAMDPCGKISGPLNRGVTEISCSQQADGTDRHGEHLRTWSCASTFATPSSPLGSPVPDERLNAEQIDSRGMQMHCRVPASCDDDNCPNSTCRVTVLALVDETKGVEETDSLHLTGHRVARGKALEEHHDSPIASDSRSSPSVVGIPSKVSVNEGTDSPTQDLCDAHASKPSPANHIAAPGLGYAEFSAEEAGHNSPAQEMALPPSSPTSTFAAPSAHLVARVVNVPAELTTASIRDILVSFGLVVDTCTCVMHPMLCMPRADAVDVTFGAATKEYDVPATITLRDDAQTKMRVHIRTDSQPLPEMESGWEMGPGSDGISEDALLSIPLREGASLQRCLYCFSFATAATDDFCGAIQPFHGVPLSIWQCLGLCGPGLQHARVLALTLFCSMELHLLTIALRCQKLICACAFNPSKCHYILRSQSWL